MRARSPGSASESSMATKQHAFDDLGVGVPPPPPPHLKVTKDFAVALGGGALAGYNRAY